VAGRRKPSAPTGPGLFDTGRSVAPTPAPTFTPARVLAGAVDVTGLTPAETGAALWRARRETWRAILRTGHGTPERAAAVHADDAAAEAWRDWAAFEDDETVHASMELAAKGEG